MDFNKYYKTSRLNSRMLYYKYNSFLRLFFPKLLVSTVNIQ